MKNLRRNALIITGPTGVGKSNLALRIAEERFGEIINADIGQFYTPLTIGTAKPAWQSSSISHHLFDLINNPVNFTVIEFRKHVTRLIDEIYQRGKIPIIVGGSGFYLNALFFPPQDDFNVPTKQYVEETEDLWLRLYGVDSKRAEEIDKNDRYRIERALSIWDETGKCPSLLKPLFDPVFDHVHFMIVNRDKDELYARINERVVQMMHEGWVEEVQSLSPSWLKFLLKKKVIGYDDIIRYLQGEMSSLGALIEIIQQKTRRYAKRQLTFNRMLTKKFEEHCNAVYTEWINLTSN